MYFYFFCHVFILQCQEFFVVAFISVPLVWVWVSWQLLFHSRTQRQILCRLLELLPNEYRENRRWCVKYCSSIDCPATRTGINWITAIMQAFYNYGQRPGLSWKVNCIQNAIWHMDFSERMEIEGLERLWTLPRYMEHICLTKIKNR